MKITKRRWGNGNQPFGKRTNERTNERTNVPRRSFPSGVGNDAERAGEGGRGGQGGRKIKGLWRLSPPHSCLSNVTSSKVSLSPLSVGRLILVSICRPTARTLLLVQSVPGVRCNFASLSSSTRDVLVRCNFISLGMNERMRLHVGVNNNFAPLSIIYCASARFISGCVNSPRGQRDPAQQARLTKTLTGKFALQ